MRIPTAMTSSGILSNHVRWMPSNPCQWPAAAICQKKQNSARAVNSAASGMRASFTSRSHRPKRYS